MRQNLMPSLRVAAMNSLSPMNSRWLISLFWGRVYLQDCFMPSLQRVGELLTTISTATSPSLLILYILVSLFWVSPSSLQMFSTWKQSLAMPPRPPATASPFSRTTTIRSGPRCRKTQPWKTTMSRQWALRQLLSSSSREGSLVGSIRQFCLAAGVGQIVAGWIIMYLESSGIEVVAWWMQGGLDRDREIMRFISPYATWLPESITTFQCPETRLMAKMSRTAEGKKWQVRLP